MDLLTNEIDVGNLSILNNNKIDLRNLRENTENYLLSLSKDNAQLLINDIFSLETERKDNEIIAKLPKICTLLPRGRTLPKQKVPTKWQQFAKEKGIIKKKKSKLNWDEELKKWIPTFGYKKVAAKFQKNWAVEIPRVGLPTTEQFASANHLAVAQTVARVSTASVGKFQDRLSKEKDAMGIAKELPGMKRKKKLHPLCMKDEKNKNTEWVNDVIFKNKKILNSGVVIPASAAPTRVPKGRKHLGKSSTKKPKAGRGKRDPHTKVGGRKRRL